MTTGEASGSSGSGLRKALVGLGVAGLAFLAARRIRSNGGAPSMDGVRETVGDVRSGEAFDIPIGETGEQADEGSESRSEGAGTTEGAIGNEPMPGEDLSSREAAERTEEDAGQEPMEPGEMTVDEEVAEEAGVNETDENEAEADGEREDEEGEKVEPATQDDENEEADGNDEESA